MKIIAGSALVLCAVVCLSAAASAQAPAGRWRSTSGSRRRGGGRWRSAALDARLVLTFERCAAYAADQDAGSTVYDGRSRTPRRRAARQRALAECGSGGSGCTAWVWGCNGPVVEESLGLDRAARRQVQDGS